MGAGIASSAPAASSANGINIAALLAYVKTGFKQNKNAQPTTFYAPANDGSSISLPLASNGNLIGYGPTNTALYTNSFTTVNASATVWVGFWYDTVEARLYCLARSATTLYLGYITNFATGAVVAVGSGCAITSAMVTANFPCYSVKRAAMGSGDFKIYQLGLAPATTISISSTTGAITVAEAAYTSGGIEPIAALTAGGIVTFTTASAISITADETILWCILMLAATTALPSYVIISCFRNGRQTDIITDPTPIGGLGSHVATSQVAGYQWGADIMRIGGQGAINQGGNGIIAGPQYLSRAGFESWLATTLNTLGAP